MQETEIVMLEDSFAEVLAVRDAAASLFYERLFLRDPSLKPMFAKADLREQGRKLMAALSLVVGSLRRFETVVPTLKVLAVRHTGYGVRDEHYATVGAALIETLALFFGERFTPDLRRIWTGAYGVVSATMMAAAHAHVAESGPALAAVG